MPFLDVSDILHDPDFADTALIVTRNSVAVGDNGRAAITAASQSFSGVVTADAGAVFERFPDAARVRGSIMIHTTFRLRFDGEGIDADIVSDAYGKRFTVMDIKDYSRYGSGFIVALCEPTGIAG